MVIVLLVPIIPFLLFSDSIDTWFAAWQKNPPPPTMVALIVIALLATDVFLPVPSSLVTTLAGSQLGALLGILASFLGMTLGAVLGFALARWWGPPLVSWLTRADDLARTEKLSQKFGPLLILAGRGVPVLAEATVLLVGMHRMPWKVFLPPMLLSNLVLAIAYGLMGSFSNILGGMPLVMGISIVVPVLLVALFRAFSGSGEPATPSPTAPPPSRESQ